LSTTLKSNLLQLHPAHTPTAQHRWRPPLLQPPLAHERVQHAPPRHACVACAAIPTVNFWSIRQFV
jgi:hypothetical protein